MVPGSTRDVMLERLTPDTAYSINIIALYADGEGNPSQAQGRTCKAVSTCFVKYMSKLVCEEFIKLVTITNSVSYSVQL